MPTYPLATPINIGQTGHAAMHTTEREAINDLAARTTIATDPDLQISAAANITINTVEAVAYGKLVHLTVSFTYTGATVTPPASGDISNITVLTIGRSGWTPAISTAASSGLVGRVATGGISTAGVMSLGAVGNTTTIASGASFSLGCTYLRP